MNSEYFQGARALASLCFTTLSRGTVRWLFLGTVCWLFLGTVCGYTWALFVVLVIPGHCVMFFWNDCLVWRDTRWLVMMWVVNPKQATLMQW